MVLKSLDPKKRPLGRSECVGQGPLSALALLNGKLLLMSLRSRESQGGGKLGVLGSAACCMFRHPMPSSLLEFLTENSDSKPKGRNRHGQLHISLAQCLMSGAQSTGGTVDMT